MKSIQKVTRVKLKMEQGNDFILLGLVSSEPDYKLSLALNKKFSISLKNKSAIRLSGDNSEITFSRFSNSDDSSDFICNLISNRSGKNFLINKLRNIDYLFQIQNQEKEINAGTVTSAIREISSVTAVFNIDIDTIKDKNLHYLTQ